MNIQLWEQCSNCNVFVWAEEIRNGECLSCRIEHGYKSEVVGTDQTGTGGSNA